MLAITAALRESCERTKGRRLQVITWARKRAARTEAPVVVRTKWTSNVGRLEVNSLAAVCLSAGGRSTQIFCPFFVCKSGIARLRRAVLRTAENPLALSRWSFGGVPPREAWCLAKIQNFKLWLWSL